MENKNLTWIKGDSKTYYSSDYQYILVKSQFYISGKRHQKWEFKQFIGKDAKGKRQYETIKTATYLDTIKRLAEEYLESFKFDAVD